MAMRAQLSLQFDDKELFEDFITPYKEGRMLNSLIIKCLSAYYYNEEVRNLIEGTSMDDVADGEAVQTSQSICDSIRASLMMQDFLASELQNTIDNGLEDIDNILNQTNDVATKSGVAHSASSEYGGNILRISMKEASAVAEQRKNQNRAPQDASLGLLINAVLKLAEASGNSEVVNMLQQDSSSSTEEVLETPSFDVGVEVSTEPTAVVEENTTATAQAEYIASESIPTVNDFEAEPISVQAPVAEESASDAIAELLGSL